MSRPNNRCESCGYEWSPRGHDVSSRCPSCGSPKVIKIVLETTTGYSGGADFEEYAWLPIVVGVVMAIIGFVIGEIPGFLHWVFTANDVMSAATRQGDVGSLAGFVPFGATVMWIGLGILALTLAILIFRSVRAKAARERARSAATASSSFSDPSDPTLTGAPVSALIRPPRPVGPAPGANPSLRITPEGVDANRRARALLATAEDASTLATTRAEYSETRDLLVSALAAMNDVSDPSGNLRARAARLAAALDSVPGA